MERKHLLASLAGAAALCGPLAARQIPAAEAVAEAAPLPAAVGEVFAFNRLVAGKDSGWLAYARKAIGPNQSEAVLYGELSRQDPLGPRILQEPGTVAGVIRSTFHHPCLAGGKIAYTTKEDAAALRVAWLDNVVLAEPGMPAGQTGSNWTRAFTAFVADDGTAAVFGRVGADLRHRIVLEYPSGNVLLSYDAPVPGTSETIGELIAVERSGNGQYLVAAVQLAPSGRNALLVNGEIYSYHNGGLALQGELAGTAAGQEPIFAFGRWDSFSNFAVNNAGDAAFRGLLIDGGEYEYVVSRGGFLVGSTGEFKNVANSGAVLLSESNTETLEGHSLFPFGSGVDTDGDGDLDQHDNGSEPTGYVLTGEGDVYGLSTRMGVGNAARDIVVRSRLTQGASSFCPGTANSWGRAASLAVIGSDVPGFNQMGLAVVGLPPLSFALPLFSLTAGAPIVPPGSVGSLCLTGAIGRSGFTAFQGSLTTDYTPIFTNAMAQPSGPVVALPGDTWYAQLWYRDGAGGTATTNFSEAVSITMR